MTSKRLFSYVGVIMNMSIVIGILQRLLKDNNLETMSYFWVIMYFFAGVSWMIHGIQNKEPPTTIGSIFQIMVFSFIFITKYYKGLSNKDGFTINRTKI